MGCGPVGQYVRRHVLNHELRRRLIPLACLLFKLLTNGCIMLCCIVLLYKETQNKDHASGFEEETRRTQDIGSIVLNVVDEFGWRGAV